MPSPAQASIPAPLRAIPVVVATLLSPCGAAGDGDIEHPGVSPGGSVLTYTATSDDPRPLLRGPSTLPDVATDLDRARRLLGADWQQAPPVEGVLGPDFDQASCLACHVEGLSQDRLPAEPLAPIARLLHPDDQARFGGQINTRSLGDGGAQGRMDLRWEETPLLMDDGTEVRLRRPVVTVVSVDGDPLGLKGPVVLRMPPALFGWGLLEEVPDAFIQHVADPDDANGDGISGRASVALNRASGQPSIGRFGWKAEQPTLEQQTAAALCNDMGISNRLFPPGECAGGPGKHTSADHAELPDAHLNLLVQAQRYLGVPDRRRREAADVQHGRVVFEQLGCPSCHLQVMQTGLAEENALHDQVVWPYSDLLLHDMGEGLADPSLGEGDENAREWRTAPLWGIGLLAERFPERGFLHDGRARTLLEAILWHGGEAEPARAGTLALDSEHRTALLTFLRSL